jgi:hypothetical protein
MLGAMQKSRKGSTLHKPQKSGLKGLKKQCHWHVKFLNTGTALMHAVHKRAPVLGDLKRVAEIGFRATHLKVGRRPPWLGKGSIP